MDLSRQKELFSEAYLRAVSSVAGCSLMKPEVDDDSVDWTVKARLYGHPSLYVQLKVTAQDVLEEDGVHFELKLKNYDELRDTNLLYRIVVVLPGWGRPGGLDPAPRRREGWLT